MSGTGTFAVANNSVVRVQISELAPYLYNYLLQLGVFADQTYNATTVTEVSSGIQQYVAAYVGQANIDLSNVSVDYETNLAEVTAVLSSQPTWKDAYSASTGQRIITIMATVLTFAQYSIVRAAQEAMLPTAVLDNSIYAATKLLGVRLQRKTPASYPCTLINSTPTVSVDIPAYSQFSANNLSLFNRTPIYFPAGTASLSTTLYEGSVSFAQFNANGGNYQQYVIGNSDYSISDIDVLVSVNGTAWTRTVYNQYFNIGLWEAGPTDQVYEDESTSDGNVQINFGNNLTGASPIPGTPVEITYVITLGNSGNQYLTGQTIASPKNFNDLITTNYSTISGTVTGSPNTGVDQPASTSYKALGPGLYAAKYRGSTRLDCAAVARRYPGVVDALFLGQQELSQLNAAYATMAYCMYQLPILLTTTQWSATDWANFEAYYYPLGIANFVLLPINALAPLGGVYAGLAGLYNAQPIAINITANVFALPLSNLTVLQNLITTYLQQKFTLREGLLGYNYSLNDIEFFIKSAATSEIDYVDVLAPTADQSIAVTQYPVLGTVTLNMYYTARNTLQ